MVVVVVVVVVVVMVVVYFEITDMVRKDFNPLAVTFFATEGRGGGGLDRVGLSKCRRTNIPESSTSQSSTSCRSFGKRRLGRKVRAGR